MNLFEVLNDARYEVILVFLVLPNELPVRKTKQGKDKCFEKIHVHSRRRLQPYRSKTSFFQPGQCLLPADLGCDSRSQFWITHDNMCDLFTRVYGSTHEPFIVFEDFFGKLKLMLLTLPPKLTVSEPVKRKNERLKEIIVHFCAQFQAYRGESVSDVNDLFVNNNTKHIQVNGGF